MPLSWNEIKTRANAFSKHWADAANEDSQAKPFLIDFFEIFGINNKRVASFEHAVKKFGGQNRDSDNKAKQGFVDLFWPGILLVEMKSKGKDLTRAYSQAIDYFSGIQERDLPRYVLVCDFQRFQLHDLTAQTVVEFTLKELYQNVKQFGFIAGYQTQIIKAQDPINIKAAERMGKLHDALKAVGYDGHALELYLVRLLFCLFAEDTTIFEKRIFQDYIETKTNTDGSDLAHHINSLFYVLNTPPNKRLSNLDESLNAFPYVNGKLFEEPLPPAQFDSKMREALLDLCALDWSIISPAIFGSLFQSIMDADVRRNLGAHYTSEENILKLIKPLFLDALWAEFEKVKGNKNRLAEFHQRLRTLTFFDPACGCGNFLVITYRELRLLELEVLRAIHKTGQLVMDVQALINIDVDQFYGIEIEEFPAQIAQVALWLTDHQMNMKISEEFGQYFARIPLKATLHIVCGNALQTDWQSVLPAERCSYVLGNPPFLGKSNQSAEQKADMQLVCEDIKNAGLLDFVAAWYIKAARYVALGRSDALVAINGVRDEGVAPTIRAAFVSTNSITQGEQVGVLWGWMLAQGIKIHFAHRTFSWNNEARGKAAVHCVIIGFGLQEVADKTIYEYEDIKGQPHAVKVGNINPYLADAPNLVMMPRTTPICRVSPMVNGSKPTDGGNLIMSEQEKSDLIANEPQAAEWIKPFAMGDEFINGVARYCLWLVDCPPQTLRAMPEVIKRIEGVKAMRLASTDATTRADSAKSTLFQKIRQPKTNYLALPRVSSERRVYIPIAYASTDLIAGDKLQTIPNASLFEFGVITSNMHMAWTRTTCGRMKSDYQYSAKITYNNFPWPESRSGLQPRTDGLQHKRFAAASRSYKAIEVCAQAVLDARAEHSNASLADLYDPLTMPANLLKAHQALDKAVDTAYGYKGANTDAARVAFLFERYQQLTSLLPVEKPKQKTKLKKHKNSF
ncbi:DNA methyltransferase [Methylotenera sp.]|uniref:DNA methyltransferase n=1 Tax=Methylotenera sp. TaxID=2051956 RepID=UPI0024886061|nr:DNA methyltransferase [Methylotenera sp.]MDI1299845.1 N-6 DNA methylase [Methylotenera sp.]